MAKEAGRGEVVPIAKDIARLVTIGVGAAVVCDIADNLTVAGVPAKDLIR